MEETLETKTLETMLDRLERIAVSLEDGNKPLEEALKLFEEGVKLAREGQKRIDDAERRIEIVLAAGTNREQVTSFSGDEE